MIGNKLTGSPSIPYLLLDRMFKGTCDMPRRHAQQNPPTGGQCERGAFMRNTWRALSKAGQASPDDQYSTLALFQYRQQVKAQATRDCPAPHRCVCT
jgi:hypothetical protein